MGIWQIIVGAVVLILSVLMIIVIILQEGHDSGLGTITGGADSFTKRGKAKTADAVFAKVTKFCAVGFFVFVVLLNALSYFGWTGKPQPEKQQQVIEASSTSSDESSAEASEQSAAEASGEESAQASDQSSTEASSQTSTEASTETSPEASAEASTETSTETSPEASTEASAE